MVFLLLAVLGCFDALLCSVVFVVWWRALWCFLVVVEFWLCFGLLSLLPGLFVGVGIILFVVCEFGVCGCRCVFGELVGLCCLTWFFWVVLCRLVVLCSRLFLMLVWCA